jgi:hypothetical protein
MAIPTSPVSAPERLIRVALLALSLSAGAAIAAEPVANVTQSSGTVSVRRGDAPPRLLSVKSEVFEGDRITTEADTFTRLKFSDGGEVVLRPNSQLLVANFSYREDKPGSDNAVLNLLKGGLRAVTGLLGKRNKERYGIETPTATIGIRGTNFGLLLCQSDCGGVPTVSGKPLENGLHIDVADGAITASNKGGSLQFNVGQFGFVRDGISPPILIPPADGVRVTVPSGIGASGNSGAGVGKDGASQCQM